MGDWDHIGGFIEPLFKFILKLFLVMVPLSLIGLATLIYWIFW